MTRYFEAVKKAREEGKDRIVIRDEDFAKAREFCKKQPSFKLIIGNDFKYYITWNLK